MPALTAAATAEAPAIAMVVLWVTWPVWKTASTRRLSGAVGKAMPTGATRIAAPLVEPERPVSSVEVPSATSFSA